MAERQQFHLRQARLADPDGIGERMQQLVAMGFADLLGLQQLLPAERCHRLVALDAPETGIAITEVAETVMGQHAALNKERRWFLSKLEAIHKWVGSSYPLNGHHLCKRQRRLHQLVGMF